MDVSAYDLLSTAVLLLDHQGCVDYANTAAEELFGNSRRVLLGESAARLLGGDDALQARFMEAVAGKFGILRQPLSVNRQGVQVPVNVAVVPLPGTPWAALVEVRIIEQHMLLERHQQLSKELAAQRETLRNLAHEVKNPLGGIRGAAQLLDAELDRHGLREYTGVIIAEADRLAHLVDRLIAPQGASLQKRRLNIHEICERVRMLICAEFTAITVERDYDASMPELSADFSRLLQAMLNVARNAAQALTEHPGQQRPHLILRTRVARQVLLAGYQARLAVVVSVIDNGPGVPPELLDKLFHPLVTGRAKGTGLGLSLAQEFVQQHGGILECDSRPGHTEFRMILPLEPT
ncbi:PAS domain-containing protein [Alcaligenaceae bacterium]|nr:PAS domain-containing protein [Alcaligenaceae bacterium]